MWVLKQQMLMRLVFVTLFQNSNPEGNKKDLISCGKMGNVELKKKRRRWMQSVHVQFDWKSYFWCLKYVLMLVLLDFYSSNVLNE